MAQYSIVYIMNSRAQLTSTHKLQSILAKRERGANQPQCESAKINPARILILAKARKKDLMDFLNLLKKNCVTYYL